MVIFIKDKKEIHPIGSFDKIQLSDERYDRVTNDSIWLIRGYKNNGKIVHFGEYNSEEEAKTSFSKLLSFIKSGEEIYTI